MLFAFGDNNSNGTPFVCAACTLAGVGTERQRKVAKTRSTITPDWPR
jgi:hypothetical protein